MNLILENIKYYILSLILLPYATFLLTVLYIYKQIVYTIIKITNKSEITWLDSADAIWTVGEVHHNSVGVLLILNSKKSGDTDYLIEEIKKSIQEKVLNNKKYPKLNSVPKTLLGYTYLIQKQITVDDCVEVVDVIKDIDLQNKSLKEITVRYLNEHLPIDNTFLWNITVFKINSECRARENLKENQIPVLLKFSHMIGDGLSIMNLSVKLFADNDIDFDKTLEHFRKNNIKKPKNFLIKLLEVINLLLMTPGFAVCDLLKDRGNIWKGPKIINKRKFACVVDNNGSIVDEVKYMKKQLGNTGFTEIILMGISASLQEFIGKISDPPDYALAIMIIIGELLGPVNNKDGDPQLKNQYTIGHLKLPVNLKSNSNLDRLQALQVETRQLAKSPELWVNHFLLTKICGVLPQQIADASIPLDKITMSISNLPGLSKLSLWKGHDIENIFFFSPERGSCGMSFCLLTYDNKLHLTLVYDEAVMLSDEMSQQLVDGVFKNLRLLKEEIKNINL